MWEIIKAMWSAIKKMDKSLKMMIHPEVAKDEAQRTMMQIIFGPIIKFIKGHIVTLIEVLGVVAILVYGGLMLSSMLSYFGAFNGRIAIDFEKFEEMNSDQSIYMDAQNTNELRKAYMQLVSETSYYQMFNLRDMNPGNNDFYKIMAMWTNQALELVGLPEAYSVEDLNYFNLSRSFLGIGTLDDRYIYSDANKNALKYMKLPKVMGIGAEFKDTATAKQVNDYFRDYYNRETTFQLSETLLSEMNRILFGEFSNVETITYPEAFAKPVAFVNDFYRIQETGRPENIGSPYVYVTQRVTMNDIRDSSSPYYDKPWLEGIIKSEPSHIIYDYAVEMKNVIYWDETTVDGDLSNSITWGNVSKYVTDTVEKEYEDGSIVDTEQALKLYWIVKDSDLGTGVSNKETNNNNPYNEHMGQYVNDTNYQYFFDGPYTKLTISNGHVEVDTSSKICEKNSSTGKFINAYEYVDGVKVRCEYNKYPRKHLQLVPIFDEYGNMQVNSRVLFNKTFVMQKSVRDSYRFFPEYFSGFSDFVEVDINRAPPAKGLSALMSGDTALPLGDNTKTPCKEADYEADMKLPFSERKCSIVRRYAGANGLAYLNAKMQDFIKGDEAEIGVSSQAMFYLLLAYDDYIIETGEFGVAWDYKYYTSTESDLDFLKAQYRDIFGFQEVFVDSWNDTAVYKNTLDNIKALDSARTVSTTYTPTSIISGQSASKADGNANINNTGYGWKIANKKDNAYGGLVQVISDTYVQGLERVAGEASLEAPNYNDGKLLNLLKNYFANSITYGASDFKYHYDDDGNIIEVTAPSGKKYSLSQYVSGAKSFIGNYTKSFAEGFFSLGTSGGTVKAITDILLDEVEDVDYRNTSEVWDPDAKIYRPNSSKNIKTNTTATIQLDTSNTGRVAYRTGKTDYLPYETKSVSDYGIGSVLSYIQDFRVVYQTGLFMDETYNKDGFKAALNEAYGEDFIKKMFPDATEGFYPKDFLNETGSLLQAMRATPIPLEDLSSLAQNIVGLQYGATEYEMSKAEDKVGSGDEDKIRDELLKIISGRNSDGIYISGLNASKEGFTLGYDADGIGDITINNTSGAGGFKVSLNGATNVCTNAITEGSCENEDRDEEKKCLLEKQEEGMYFNEALYDCEVRCEVDYETSVKGIHPSLTVEEVDEETARFETRKNKCLEVCKSSYPNIDMDCNPVNIGGANMADVVKSLYAYSPYLEPNYWDKAAETLLGRWFQSNRNYDNVQFLDPLQYYIGWIDFETMLKDPETLGDYLNKAIAFLNGQGSGVKTQLHAGVSQTLLGVQSGGGGFPTSTRIHKDFGDAGTSITGAFKQEFFNAYGTQLEPVNLIVENESYRVYMIDEAVTFLGTFSYTYKTDINNIGAGGGQTQVIGVGYADRYYYLSNYIFAVPKVEYVAEVYDSYVTTNHPFETRAAAEKKCINATISSAQKEYAGKTWYNPLTWLNEEKDVIDVADTCSVTSTCVDWSCAEYATKEDGSRGGCIDWDCDDYDYDVKTYGIAVVPESDKFSAAKGQTTTFSEEDVYIIDSVPEVQALQSELTDTDLANKLFMNLKVYASLDKWALSISNTNSTDISIGHDYGVNYANGTAYYGDNVNHYGKYSEVNNELANRYGYKADIEGGSTVVDGLLLPDDLNMEINYDEGLFNPFGKSVDATGKAEAGGKITESDLDKILTAATEMCGEDCEPQEEWVSVYDGSNYVGRFYLKTGTGLTQDAENIGVGVLYANREEFGYPIPFFRHFAGVTREILPRERGYYFNGEVFDSWHSRLILTDETTRAQRDNIFEEKDQLQSYLYDYIMNFETYVPLDVKSDYDLMSRGREPYHSSMVSGTTAVSSTTSLSSNIYNVASSEAWSDTISQFAGDLDAADISQLISGLIEVSVNRGVEKTVKVLNQGITNDNDKISNSSNNTSAIKSAIMASINATGSSNVSSIEVELELNSGSKKKFRLTDVGPGMIFYDYNKNGDGVISTKDVAYGQVCNANCFKDVELTVNDTVDERLDKDKALEYVSTKFGKLIRKYGNVKHAIYAYFHGEIFTTEMVKMAKDEGWGESWMNSDSNDKIAKVLSNVVGEYDDDATKIQLSASDIDAFMYSSSVISSTMSYVQNTESQQVLNNASIIPASASAVELGTKLDFARSVYAKWKTRFDTYCAKHQVDVALAVAMFTQESGGNSYAGICGGDSILTDTALGTRKCTDLSTGRYNGGGGIGQIHASSSLCDSGSYGGANRCPRTVKSKVAGNSVTVMMADPKHYVKSISDLAAYERIDDRYGDIDKSFEWAIILISNLLQESNNDGFKAAARYNGWPSSCSLSDPNWYKCYSQHRNENTTYPDYIKHIARYYDQELASGTLNMSALNLGYTGAGDNGMSTSFGLKTGELAFQRDMYQIQNSGIEYYKPRLTTSRDDVTSLILNVSNFGKENYYMYAKEHDLLSLFTARLEDSDASSTSWLGGNPQIIQEGKILNSEVDPNYKFAHITPIIPMYSPMEKDVESYKVSSPFGMRYVVENNVQSGTKRGMHNGVDFAISSGTSLFATNVGTVTKAQNMGGYGNMVEIRHVVPAGTIVTDSSGKQYQITDIFTRYAHLTSYKVNVGDVIQTSCTGYSGGGKCFTLNDVIAISGNTGNSTGAHLHYEIFVHAVDMETGQPLPTTNENTKCDPYYWLTTKWQMGATTFEGAMSDPEINATIATIKAQYPNLSPMRESLIRNALTLVGKVGYFWGGGHEGAVYMGAWNPDWGTPRKVTVGGHRTSGTFVPYGLDCSGFTRWAVANTLGFDPFAAWNTVTGQWDCTQKSEKAGTGGKINVMNPQPGDLAAYGDKAHVGIYLYTDANGKKVYVHCSNGVEVGNNSKFTLFFTPQGLQ